jgi:DNA-binding HxlR family transcriptional regulator
MTFPLEDGTFLVRRYIPVTNEVTTMDDDEISPAQTCSLREVLDLVGDKWAIRVLVQLADGPRRFSELERALDGVSRRMLALTLRGLERNGLVTRKVYPEVPPRVEYTMTPHAAELDAPLHALSDWAAKHRARVAAAREAYDLANV